MKNKGGGGKLTTRTAGKPKGVGVRIEADTTGCESRGKKEQKPVNIAFIFLVSQIEYCNLRSFPIYTVLDIPGLIGNQSA